MLVWLGYVHNDWFVGNLTVENSMDLWWQLPMLFAAGVVILFGTLHLARGIGLVHGRLAKHLLVRASRDSQE